jgi:mannose-6-phosphate isomerase-like protein (cupin superfamily)
VNSTPLQKATYVPAGLDRHTGTQRLIWGQIPMATKVATRDTGGNWFLFEHKDMPKGGPPKHIHEDQDEWFYAIKGEFAIEVGDEKFRLKPGDSFLAPRKVPHVWACISNEPGTLLTALSPAGTFEQFMLELTALTQLPTMEEAVRIFAKHGMTIVGPPMEV